MLNNLPTKSMARIALMSAITIGLSFVRVPYIVPFTLQTLSCMIAGLILPRKEAVISQLIYVVLGLIGIPVFSAGGGFSYVLYPTFGFIFFMPIMTYIIATLKNKNILLAIAAGSFPQLLFGALYYYYIVTNLQGAEQTVGAVLMALFVPYIPVEALKGVAAYMLYFYLPKSLKQNK